MNQNQLYREVARATGETVDFIRKRGFGIVIVQRHRARPRGEGGQARAQQSKPVDPVIQQLKAA